MGKNWTLNVYDVPDGRKIVMTEGIGQAEVEDVKKVTEVVLSRGKKFGGKWAYIPMIEKMDPIFDAETQKAFAEMHKLCEEAGCVAMAFVAGGMASIKVQAKRHQQASNAGKLVVEHFRTKEDALKWLEGFGL